MSFTSLLELLDDQRFSRNILPDERQLSQVMIRRLKTDLVDKEGKPHTDTAQILTLSHMNPGDPEHLKRIEAELQRRDEKQAESPADTPAGRSR